MKSLLLSTALTAGLASAGTAQDARSPFQSEPAGASVFASEVIGARIYASEAPIDAGGDGGVRQALARHR
jgi:hypothetical protein